MSDKIDEAARACAEACYEVPYDSEAAAFEPIIAAAMRKVVAKLESDRDKLRAEVERLIVAGRTFLSAEHFPAWRELFENKGLSTGRVRCNFCNRLSKVGHKIDCPLVVFREAIAGPKQETKS